MLRQREPRIIDKTHLAFVARLPCLITGRRGVHVAHIRYGNPTIGKRHTGLQEKPDDCWTVPLDPHVHLHEQHRMNEKEFWRQHGIDPCLVAQALFKISGNDEAGRAILRSARRTMRWVDDA